MRHREQNATANEKDGACLWHESHAGAFRCEGVEHLTGYKESAAEFEPHWRNYWADNRIFETPNPDDPEFDPSKRKSVILDFFPYPSGIGLHVGHPLGYIATDVVSRHLRMRGRNVLHAMGFDAFGLPAEQYAIQTGQHPRVTTDGNIANMIQQLQILGFDHDTTRRFGTHEPSYYKWTQWIFLQIYGSFYDPTTRWVGPDGREYIGRALPITSLADKLRSGEWVVNSTGIPTPSSLTAPNDKPLQPFREEALTQFEDRVRLAYQEEVPVNWCPQLGTVLSDEEVTRDGRSERGNFPVYRRPLRQWMLRIRDYADRLTADLDLLEWPAGIKEMQRNWIGKSDGMLIQFLGPTASGQVEIPVFTTRPDTIFGATFLVLAPAHPAVGVLTSTEQETAVSQYREHAAQGTGDIKEASDISGVFTGGYVRNPATGEAIPVWIADYVLMNYGTGAIMAVPCHDDRDWLFARQFGLPVRPVVDPPDDWLRAHAPAAVQDAGPAELRTRYFASGGRDFGEAFTGIGTAVQSANTEISLNQLPTPAAKEAISAWLETQGTGRRRTDYRLRNWLFSRQRYWGEPFPIVYDIETGRRYAVSPRDLPVQLPDLEDFTPLATDDPSASPESPLGRATDWAEISGIVLDDASVVTVNAHPGSTVEVDGCDHEVRRFRRELNTMPNWAGSCWYYLRYCDPHNDKQLVSKAAERYWMSDNGRDREGKIGGVDLYVGGAEHAVLHLLYARFWHKILFDLGHVSVCEPFQKLFNQGMITADAFKDSRGFYVDVHDIAMRKTGAASVPVHKETGEVLEIDPGKMGKRYKNGLPPEEICAQFTVDVFRLYEMYMGPLEATKPWNTEAIIGMQRFLGGVWRTSLLDVIPGDPPIELNRMVHKTIRKVTQDIEKMAMNTAISSLIELTNTLSRQSAVHLSHLRSLLLLLAPFTPHLSEELFFRFFPEEHRQARSVAFVSWPAHDESIVADTLMDVPITVNGSEEGSDCASRRCK
jgi:leucyl-tRNA synthetase